MKKSKVNTLRFNKSTVSRFRIQKVAGGNGTISTAEWCIATGVPDGCIISENCRTNGCGGGGGGTHTCQTVCQIDPCYG
ncbi:hypothetical protein [Ascidiimonas aurantiaca]|uniref:hypothetical protein n=1 Tax=Ascidiimonas aurantiaca TaxID=1685432 RepID=UPI0030EBCED4